MSNHYEVGMESEQVMYGTARVRFVCSCGWRGAEIAPPDEARREFLAHVETYHSEEPANA